jgi:hypothetical protein
MNKLFFLATFSVLLNAYNVSAQTSSEPAPAIVEQAWYKSGDNLNVSFANSNVRYPLDQVPQLKTQQTWKASAWRGEKVHTQLLVWSKNDVDKVRIKVTDLKNNSGGKISKNQISTGFIGYVMTDEYKDGCGYRKSVDFDSSLVADPINTSINAVSLKKQTVQPIWISVQVPDKTSAGTYSGELTVDAGTEQKLQVSIIVSERILPPPSAWRFNLDLWQHPAAVARVHNVALWSDAHFDWMKKYYTMLAAAGQKNITASIVNEPWGHQTYDDYPGLIRWTKKKDGNWSYDYSLFDKYVSFVMSCGIKQRINCYSMVPWKIAFTYFDESLGKETELTSDIGTEEYNNFWRPMLVDFTKHLKTKGWFSITTIAMDERPMPAMQSVIKLLKEVDTNWKIALAGDYHSEIEKDIYDYCIASRLHFPADTLQVRQQQGKLSTWYTCCAENYPNGFTFSPPAEHVWIGWYTAAKNMDGYLRWAYNSWTATPLHDSRFTAWPAGDTYQVYPGPLSSIRFEKLIEGIQDYEKIRILKDEFAKKDQQKLKELESILSGFAIDKLSTIPAEQMVIDAKERVSKL